MAAWSRPITAGCRCPAASAATRWPQFAQARRALRPPKRCIAISSIAAAASREAIGHASLDGPWLAAGPIRPGIRSRYDQDIFRIGNIAGESHPIIAEGISMAMQSGWLLADQLRRAKATEPAERALRRRTLFLRLAAAVCDAHPSPVRPLRRSPIQPASARMMTAMIRLLPAMLTLGAALSGKTKGVPGLA